MSDKPKFIINGTEYEATAAPQGRPEAEATQCTADCAYEVEPLACDAEATARLCVASGATVNLSISPADATEEAYNDAMGVLEVMRREMARELGCPPGQITATVRRPS